MLPPLKYFNKDSGRPHVPAAIREIVNRYDSGEGYTSIFSPPRTGKSSVIQGAAVELRERGAPFCMCIEPWSLLVDQITDKDIARENIAFYVEPSLGRPYITSGVQAMTSDFYHFTERSIDLFGCTIGLLQANRNAFFTAVSRAREETGLRPVVFVDEGHLLSTFQAWGALAEAMVDHGVYVAVLTGTNQRRDHKPIPGFEFKATKDWIERENRLIRKRVDNDGVIRYYSSLYKVSILNGEDLAHYSFPGGWNMAFERGYLHRLNIVWIDDPVHVTNKDGQPELKKIEELSHADLNKMLRGISEGESLVVKTTLALVERLRDWRKSIDNIKALIVTGSDKFIEDGGHNRHARQVKRATQEACERYGLNIRVEIATSVTATGEPDTTAELKIKAFRGNPDAIAKIGTIDILIVKTMGIVGLDVPRLKVMANLSTIRIGPLAYQLYTRPVTQLDQAKGRPADLILVRDKLNIELVDQLKSIGAITARKTDSMLLDEEEIEPPEKVEEKWKLGNNAHIAGYTDESGSSKYLAGDKELLLRAIKSKYFFGNMTDTEILSNYEKGAYGTMEEEVERQREEISIQDNVAINLTDKLSELQGRFGRKAKELINMLFSYGTDPARYRKELTEFQFRAKRRIGVNIPIEDINDPDLLERCIAALDDEYATLRANHHSR